MSTNIQNEKPGRPRLISDAHSKDIGVIHLSGYLTVYQLISFWAEMNVKESISIRLVVCNVGFLYGFFMFFADYINWMFNQTATQDV